MRLAVISFTRTGYELSEKLKNCMPEYSIELFVKCSAIQNEVDASAGDVMYLEGSIEDWAKEQFQKKNALLFLGAAGIAVRAIASCVDNKLSDSPVLVMDEQGRYVIPLLSGHVGGANELAVTIAKRLEAVPVITTATDLRHEFAVDLFAKRNGLSIVNQEGIAKVSAKVLEGEPVTMAVPAEHLPEEALPEGALSEERLQGEHLEREGLSADVWIGADSTRQGTALLYLEPKEYVIGIGCKKGKDAGELLAFVKDCLAEHHIAMHQVAYIASVDVKKEEEGIRKLAEAFQVPFLTFSPEELNQVEGEFQESDFVKDTVGVGNVCERAALAACEHGGVLVQKKKALQGMTAAIAKRKWRIEFYEA